MSDYRKFDPEGPEEFGDKWIHTLLRPSYCEATEFTNVHAKKAQKKFLRSKLQSTKSPSFDCS